MVQEKMLEVVSQKGLTIYSKGSKIHQGLLSDEVKIIENKYKSDRFSVISETELLRISAILLLKIHVITGWELPKSELMDLLIDQFSKKLVESYPDVNQDEVEYAFRNKPVGVKEWGKFMNLSLLDDVMLPFLANRRRISNLEESNSPVVQIEHKPSAEDLEKINEEFAEFLKTDEAKKYGFCLANGL